MNSKSSLAANNSVRNKANRIAGKTYYLRIAFLVAIGALLLVFLGLLIITALPQPEYELIGSIQDYPVSSKPYDLRGTAGYYLVNTGTEVIALNPRSPRNEACRVLWDAVRGEFQDPCLGTRFDVTGRYVNGPPSPALGRYPTRIDDQRIWVSTNSISE